MAGLAAKLSIVPPASALKHFTMTMITQGMKSGHLLSCYYPLLECRTGDKATLKSQLNNVLPSFTTQLVPSVDSGQEETIDFFSLKRALLPR